MLELLSDECQKFGEKGRRSGLDPTTATEKFATSGPNDGKIDKGPVAAAHGRGPSQRGTIMPCRGVRGATTAEANTRDEILTATQQLLTLMIRQNGIEAENVGSALFTLTGDLDAEFPAFAARQLGWMDVPLLCGNEIGVPGSLPHCIRILVNWNTPKSQKEIVHIYIKGAESLRPDVSSAPPFDLEQLDSWTAEIIAGHASLPL